MYVGDGNSVPTFGLKLLIDFFFPLGVETWGWIGSSARSDRVIEGD
jgi:hypothetical protein